MTNSKELFRDLVSKVLLPEDKEEVHSIIYLLLHYHCGLDRKDVMAERETKAKAEDFQEYIERINAKEPIQYILGEADFFGRKFYVNPSVLIPRPETELLIVRAMQESPAAPSVLDIGVGSGCIAITLALELPNSKVKGIDISEGALDTAKKNALRNNAIVDFKRANMLELISNVSEVDLLVSNPPYITQSEGSSMKKNVLEFEPTIALFVPDEDPLLFYRAIAQQGLVLLKTGGKLIVEINERFGKETAALLRTFGYHSISIGKDISGKDRIVTAAK